jgi:hypothetical protein
MVAQDPMTFATADKHYELPNQYPLTTAMQDVAFNMTVNSESIGVEDPHFGGDPLTAE